MEEHLADRIKHLTDECGLINEFKLAYSVREEMPLHYALAKAFLPVRPVAHVGRTTAARQPADQM